MESYVIASGKGGTGKTTVTAGVGTALAERGLKCLVIDGDAGMQSLDLTLGMYDTAPLNFADVSEGRTDLLTAVTEHPARSGLFLLNAPIVTDNVDPDALKTVTEMARQSGKFDFLLIDAPAGIGNDFRRTARAADRGIIVVTSDSVCLRSAEKTVFALEQNGVMDCRMIINRVRPRIIERNSNIPNIDDAMDLVGVPLLGMIPEDENVLVAGALGHSVPGKSPAYKAFSNIAARLDSHEVPLMKIRKTR